MPEKDEKGGLVRANTGALQKISSDIVSRGLTDLALLENRILQIGQQQTIRCEKDGAEMVLIPAGDFQMGDALGDDNVFHNEKPVHRVYLDAFYIDKYEVTNVQYHKFVKETGYSEPEGIAIGTGYGYGFKPWSYHPDFNGDNKPVVCVSCYDAIEYCKWAGKRLPTEAEWEKAARGGMVGKRYPWGNRLTPDDANYTNDVKRIYGPSPVDSFPPNGYGLFDMAGNVCEWCSDWYDKNYYRRSPKSNPVGPDFGNDKIVRGGSWDYGNGFSYSDLRIAYRFPHSPYACVSDIGFRCAMDVPK